MLEKRADIRMYWCIFHWRICLFQRDKVASRVIYMYSDSMAQQKKSLGAKLACVEVGPVTHWRHLVHYEMKTEFQLKSCLGRMGNIWKTTETVSSVPNQSVVKRSGKRCLWTCFFFLSLPSNKKETYYFIFSTLIKPTSRWTESTFLEIPCTLYNPVQ